MVARGDLGVEMPPEDVPSIQREIIHVSRMAGKPVVVATQMLESMVRNPVPTRAEASDVATAVYEGADAVMLSAETAAGSYPVEAVTMMDRIIRRVQADPIYFPGLHTAARVEADNSPSDAISAAASQVAHSIGAAAIVSYTTSGATALRMARERPDVPILALTSNLRTARRLAVAWGLHCIHTHDVRNFNEMVQHATRAARSNGFAEKSQRVVITAGVPFGTPGATNILRVAWVES
jgi:pyruvate kinase